MISLLAFMLTACEPPPPPIPGAIERTGEVIKVVNGQNVTQGMLDAQLEQLPANVRDQVVARGQMDQVKDQIVIGELLYQEAVKQKLHEDAKVKVAISLAERNALASALLERTVEARTNDEAIKKWYDEHDVQFARPQVKARHILVKDKIKTQLRDEVVKAYIEEMKAGATIVEPGAATGGATVTETKPAGEAKPEDKPATPPPN